MKTLIFDIWGDFGHFKKFYTVSSPFLFHCQQQFTELNGNSLECRFKNCYKVGIIQSSFL